MVKRYIDNQVEERGYTGARVQGADFGQDQLGRAVQGFGQQLGVVTQTLDEIGQEYDQAAVKQADAEDLARIAEIRARAMGAQGFEAQDAVKQARQEIQEIRRQRMAGLKGTRQQRMYDDVFSRRNAQLEESFSTHLVEQTRAAEQGASKARGEAAVTAARDTYGTTEFDAHVATALAEVAAVNRGAGPEAIAAAQAKVKSSILAQVIDAQINNPDTASDAEALINKHAPELLPDHEDALRKRMYPILEEDQTEADVGQAFSMGVTGIPTPQDNQTQDPADPLAPLDEGAPSEPKAPVKPQAKPRMSRVFDHRELVQIGSISNTASQHRARGSGNGIDIAAPAGSPIRPPMSGKVIANTWHKDGGWTVLVEHPNGYVTGYAHMRAKSPLEVGAEVERDTVIGGVGSTGRSSGPHLHFTVRQSRGGPKIDPQTARWVEGAASTGPVEGRVDPKSVDWDEGKYADYSAGENERGQIFSNIRAIAERDGWSTRRYNRAIARASQIMGVREAVASEKYEQIRESVWETIAQKEANGSPITSVKDVSNFGLLKGGDKMTVMNMIQANIRAAQRPDGEAVEANGATYLDLIELSEDPARTVEFLNVDIRQIPDITRGERARLVAKQARLRGTDPQRVAPDHGRVWTFVNRYIASGAAGIRTGKEATAEDARRRGLLFDVIRDEMEATQARIGRPLTDEEVDGIVRKQVVTVTRRTPGRLYGENKTEMPLYVYRRTVQPEGARATVSVPVGARDAIVRAYRMQHGGRMPTSEEITDIYIRQQGR